MCEYYCIVFINFMLKGKSLSGYINSFSIKNFKRMIKITKKISVSKTFSCESIL